METELSDEALQAAKDAGTSDWWKERAEFFESTLRLSVSAHARCERELGQVRHQLKQAEVLASRYPELLRTIGALADLCEEIPRDLMVVVQEACAVTGCVQRHDEVQ